MISSEFTLQYGFDNYVLGQRRTNKNKQYVFLAGDYVYKGPYTEARLETIMKRAEHFKRWQTPCVLLPLESCKTVAGLFLVFPNVMKDYELATEEYTESWSGFTYKVLVRGPVNKLNSKIPDWLTGKVLEELILALCHAYILGIGDMNMANILVDYTLYKVYIVDYDDSLSRDRRDATFYFNKPPGIKYKWQQLVQPTYSAVVLSLNDLDVTTVTNGSSRLQNAVNLLTEYSEKAVTSSTTEKVVTSSSTGKVVSGVTTEKAATSSSTEKAVSSSTEEVTESVPSSGIVWKGPFGGSKTVGGFSLDICKSGLQKYVRRGILHKAEVLAFELFRFKTFAPAAAVVSNLYNRIACIAAEDVSIANLGLVLEVIRLVQAKNREPSVLLKIVQLLCNSKKTRICSHAWRVYTDEAIAYINRDTGPRATDGAYVDNHIKDSCFLPSDPENLKELALIFDARLSTRDMNAFYWAKQFLVAAQHKKLKLRRKFSNNYGNNSRTTKPDILLWCILRKYLVAEVVDTLVDAYYDKSENQPYLATAIMAVIYDVKYEPLKLDTSDIDKDHLYKLLFNKFTITLDPYVIDKHTAEGRSLGRNIKDFVDEGAKVENLATEYYDVDLEFIYKSSVK